MLSIVPLLSMLPTKADQSLELVRLTWPSGSLCAKDIARGMIRGLFRRGKLPSLR